MAVYGTLELLRSPCAFASSSMVPSDWISIVGWVAAPLLEKAVTNGFANEIRTISFYVSEVDLRIYKSEIESLTAKLGVQVFITSERYQLQEPGYVSILVCNTSGKKLKDVSFSFGFSPSVGVRKHAWEFGILKKDSFKSLSVYENAICIKADHLDEDQSFRCFFLLDRYTPGAFFLDAASPEDNIKTFQISSESLLSSKKTSNSFLMILKLSVSLALSLLFLTEVLNIRPSFPELTNPFVNSSVKD